VSHLEQLVLPNGVKTSRHLSEIFTVSCRTPGRRRSLAEHRVNTSKVLDFLVTRRSRDNQDRLLIGGDAVKDCKKYLRMRDEG
jgi:hypothetical protein